MSDTRNVESIDSMVAYSILQYQIDAIIETMKSFAPTLRSQLHRALAMREIRPCRLSSGEIQTQPGFSFLFR